MYRYRESNARNRMNLDSFHVLLRIIGYWDIEEFLKANPRAIERLLDFVMDEKNPQWEKALAKAIEQTKLHSD